MKLLLSVILCAIPLQPAPRVTCSFEQVNDLRSQIPTFLHALAQVESSGRCEAVGDGGKALGKHQIWRAYWADAVEFCPELRGDYRDVTQSEYADRVVCAYWLRYCPDAVRNHDWQVLARVHNGGPGAVNSKAIQRATDAYWARVQREFARAISR